MEKRDEWGVKKKGHNNNRTQREEINPLFFLFLFLGAPPSHLLNIRLDLIGDENASSPLRCVSLSRVRAVSYSKNGIRCAERE